jgi:predicted DNA-binding transcriptional regulator YafY
VDKFDRIYALHGELVTRRRPVTLARLADKLQCSEATVKRCIYALRHTLGAPLVYVAESRGYVYERGEEGQRFELPGLWFNAEELRALVTLHEVFTRLEPGLLSESFRPLQRRLEELIHHKRLNLGEFAKRIRLISQTARPPGRAFAVVASATLRRLQIEIRYHARTRNQVSLRTVSPQRLTRYRSAWYLDAYCHERLALRSFAVERILEARIKAGRCRHFTEPQLDAHFTSAYGIFAGHADQTAVLVFSPERARWVSEESWHPEQEGRFLEDGRYELRIPYREAEELIMDILRHGSGCEVVAPKSLRDSLTRQLREALEVYQPSSRTSTRQRRRAR